MINTFYDVYVKFLLVLFEILESGYHMQGSVDY